MHMHVHTLTLICKSVLIHFCGKVKRALILVKPEWEKCPTHPRTYSAIQSLFDQWAVWSTRQFSTHFCTLPLSFCNESLRSTYLSLNVFTVSNLQFVVFGELFGILLAPLLLIFFLPSRSNEIIQFYRENFIKVKGQEDTYLLL